MNPNSMKPVLPQELQGEMQMQTAFHLALLIDTAPQVSTRAERS